MPTIGRALTAAARQVKYDRNAADKIKEESWTDRAWSVYDRLGPLYFMTQYRSHIANKIDYFPARKDEAEQDPDLDKGPAAKVLDAEGGPSLIRRIVTEMMPHWDVSGEAYLVRFEDAPNWRLLSTKELKTKGRQKLLMWIDEEGNSKDQIDPENVYRIWQPHPRHYWSADSATRHVLDDAEELILMKREMRARSHSRLPAGLLLLPDTLDLSAFADDLEGTADDVGRWLTDLMARAVVDPGSTTALTPTAMTMNAEDIEKVRHLTFERRWDIDLDHYRELLKSVTIGLDLPPEVIFGMADLNHWSAWLVSEQAVSQHVAPTVDDILDSVSTNWYVPLLEAGGVDTEGAVLWRDLSPATVAPDRSEVAIRMYEAGALSGKALRRVTDFDEEDAPTPEELERIEAKKSRDLPVRGEPEGDRNEAITAASALDASELSRIDAELLSWTVEAAGNEIDRILATISDPEAVRNRSDTEWLALLALFASRLDKRIAAAQLAARRWVERLVGSIPDEGEDTNRSNGVTLVVAGVLTAIIQALFTPDGGPDPIDVGELLDRPIPVAAIRQGLSVAGGGTSFAAGARAWELVANGHDNILALEQRGYRSLSFRWDYGITPRVFEFPPHKALDGREFDSWESEVLAVGEGGGWLRRPYYSPGDHRGCLCLYARILTVSLPIAASV